jgi:hypothetical protein
MLFCWNMVELRRRAEKLKISPTVWGMTLDLGLLCGWTPGTTGEHGWPMDYIVSCGQMVSVQDAQNLADALGRANDSAQRAIEDWKAGRSQPAQKLRTPASGFNWFDTQQGREHLRRVMAFLRAGAFEIH